MIDASTSLRIDNLGNVINAINFSSELGIDNIEEISEEEIKEIIQRKKEKLRTLRSKEEEFNKNAALVPESDPNIQLLNDKIMHVKEDVDKLTTERTLLNVELKRV